MDYEVKADALEDSFDAVEMKPERPVLVAEQPAYLTAFDGFVRRGETGGVKSFSGATTTDGGFAVRGADANTDRRRARRRACGAG